MDYRFNELLIAHSAKLALAGDDRLSTCKSSWALAHGMCFAYAYLFQATFGGQIVSYATQTPYGRQGHCFVRKNGFYYDSENREGQVNWKKLQSYMKFGRDKNVIHHRHPRSALRNHWCVSAQTLAALDELAVLIKKAYFAPEVSPSSASETSAVTAL